VEAIGISSFDSGTKQAYGVAQIEACIPIHCEQGRVKIQLKYESFVFSLSLVVRFSDLSIS
jgi:hypothetical protein